jgi:hypothetical protein
MGVAAADVLTQNIADLEVLSEVTETFRGVGL